MKGVTDSRCGAGASGGAGEVGLFCAHRSQRLRLAGARLRLRGARTACRDRAVFEPVTRTTGRAAATPCGTLPNLMVIVPATDAQGTSQSFPAVLGLPSAVVVRTERCRGTGETPCRTATPEKAVVASAVPAFSCRNSESQGRHGWRGAQKPSSSRPEWMSMATRPVVVLRAASSAAASSLQRKQRVTAARRQECSPFELSAR